MSKTATTYPLTAVRTLALHTQGLTTRSGDEPSPTPDTICELVDQIGCVQIDTLQMVHRSHYLTVWSRLGCYDPTDLDRLVYGNPDASAGSNDRRLFEGWLHAASIIPLSEYRYRLPHMRRARERPSKWMQRWLSQPGTDELMQFVMERVRREGPLRASDFEYKGPKRDSWWDWKPAKRALEHLFACGDLMIANRVNFQRVYDLRERVLPDWVDRTEPTRQEMIRRSLALSVRALGACQPNQVSDYVHSIKRAQARPVVEDLIAEDILVEVEAKLSDGGVHTLIVHQDNLPILEQAADGELTPERTTFLNPFDNLFWARDRGTQFWNFRQILEAYKPKAQREWGYYCLPILHQDRLVGRFDPKLERKTDTLRIKALYLEPDVEPEEELVAGVAQAMCDFMAFHKASEVIIERSEPAEFGEKLLAVL